MTYTLQPVDDVARATANMVAGAIAVTTGRMKLDQPDDAWRLLATGDSVAIGYFRHELAHQIAMLLMRADEHVSAVYKEHELPEAEELGAPDAQLTDPMHLVVYSERGSAALRSLLGALDQTLADALSELSGAASSGLIEAEIVNAAGVHRMIGRAGGFRPPPTLLVSREG